MNVGFLGQELGNGVFGAEERAGGVDGPRRFEEISVLGDWMWQLQGSGRGVDGQDFRGGLQVELVEHKEKREQEDCKHLPILVPS